MTRLALSLCVLAAPAFASPASMLDALNGATPAILVAFVAYILCRDDVREFLAWIVLFAFIALCGVLAAPAFAAGDAGPAITEGPYVQFVHVEEILGTVDLGAGDMAQVAQAAATTGTAPGVWFAGGYSDDPLYCGIDLDCGDWGNPPGAQPLPPGVKPPPEPAPIPLPWSGLMLTAALGMLWKWRRT